jgi:hypothetical protein
MWGQPPSALQRSSAPPVIPGEPCRASLDRTAEGGCSHVNRGDSATQLATRPLYNARWAAALALGCVGLCRWNCDWRSRLAPATLVGGGIDRLCLVERVLAPVAGQAGVHRGIGYSLFPRRARG